MSQSSAGTRDSRSRNPQVQWLRAIAALLVMLFHTTVYQDTILHEGNLHGVLGDSFGYFGVALFFAISGYLMSLAIRVQTPFMFLCHRVVRIYPLYFIASLVFYAVTAALGDPIHFDPLALLLMPLAKVHYHLIKVEWTLLFEITFYVALFVIAWAGLSRCVLWITLGWLVAIAATSLIAPDDGAHLLFPIYQMLFVSICVPMAGGLLLPTLLKWRVPPWLLLCLAILPCAAHAALPAGFADIYDLSRWLFGISAILTLWGMLRLSAMPGATHPGRFGAMLATYGDYSYALYLCHVPVIGLVYTHIHSLGLWEIWMVAVALAILASILLGRLDVTLYRKLKARVEALPPRMVKTLALTYFSLFLAASCAGAVKYDHLDRLNIGAQAGARSMLAQQPIIDNASARTAAEAAGFVLSNTVLGGVDGIRYDTMKKRLVVDAWGFDSVHPGQPVFIAVFRQGRLLVADLPIFERKDIAAQYGARTKTGYHFEKPEPCDPAIVTLMAFTSDKRFQILSGVDVPLACSPPQ